MRHDVYHHYPECDHDINKSLNTLISVLHRISKLLEKIGGSDADAALRTEMGTKLDKLIVDVKSTV